MLPQAQAAMKSVDSHLAAPRRHHPQRADSPEDTRCLRFPTVSVYRALGRHCRALKQFVPVGALDHLLAGLGVDIVIALA